MFEGFLMAGLELHNFSVHKYGYIRDDFSCVQPALVPRVSPVWAASHKRKSLGLLGSSFFLKNGCYSCSPTDSVKVLNSKNRIGECYVFVIWSKISQSDFRLENRTYLE